MEYWESGIVLDLLILALLLGVAALLVHAIPRLRRLAVPNAMVAGVLGLTLGPSGLGLIPTDIEAMELIAYHAFAVLFIAVGLQAAPRTRRPGAARSLAVANASIGVLQAILGFGLLAIWLLVADPLHSGFGTMITLGFQQGPGQALAVGKGWEQYGLVDGAQIGLVFATLGFAACIGIGIPLVAVARRRGWLTPQDEIATVDEPVAPADLTTTASSGSPDPDRRVEHEPLSMQLVIVGCVYLAVFLLISGLVSLLPPGSKLPSTLWGLHFILGSLLAIALRSTLRRTGRDRIMRDDMLARISVIAVDITTAGAIAAVRLEVLTAYLVPILVMTLSAAVLTLLGCLWLARRAFPEAPFAHSLVLFGMGTGTLSTGLALLRMLDPELRGTVARNSVIGATASVPFNAPLFLLVIPIAQGLSSQGPLVALGGPLAILVGYWVVLMVCWRLLTPLRLLRPLRSLWPADPRPTADD